MKLEVLRKLIREEVRAAVKEELQDMLTEAVKIASTPETKKPTNQYQQVPKGQPKKWSFGRSATLDEMLQHTAATMTAEDSKNIAGAGNVKKPNFATSMGAKMGMTENAGPMPGIDISKLDFVKNAGAIYKAAVAKDKARGL